MKKTSTKMSWSVIDEEMVPYFGRHSCKMFIKGKPIRFGFKIWAMCSSTGYMYQFMPYGGASTPYDKTVGLGASVILSLLEKVPNPSAHRVFFDNFFTSYHLMCLLTERRFLATGTVRSNRVYHAVLDQKMARGKWDHQFSATNKILAVTWQDNSTVSLLTNHSSIEPVSSAKRYDRKQKKIVTVPMPKLIKEYNVGMGGVDLHDNAVANYRIGVRGKKWWWPLFTNALGNIMVNAWKIHVMCAKLNKKRDLSQLQFRSAVTYTLLTLSSPESDNENESAEDEYNVLPGPNPRQRSHIVGKDENKVRLRCKVCHKHTIYRCLKCNVALHPKCFSIYSQHMG